MSRMTMSMTPHSFAAHAPRQGVLGAIRNWFHETRRRARDQDALAMLSDFDLRDLGRTRMELEYEIVRPRRGGHR